MNATDEDSGANAEIKYSIATPVKGITIDPNTGALFANRSSLSSASDIEVAVVATDRGSPPLRSITSVRIRVKNDYEYLPRFTQEEYQ